MGSIGVTIVLRRTGNGCGDAGATSQLELVAWLLAWYYIAAASVTLSLRSGLAFLTESQTVEVDGDRADGLLCTFCSFPF